MSWGPSGQVQARNPRPYRSPPPRSAGPRWPDRKSTRLNSSHSQISYAVFCLKKKKANSPLTVKQSPAVYFLPSRVPLLADAENTLVVLKLALVVLYTAVLASIAIVACLLVPG